MGVAAWGTSALWALPSPLLAEPSRSPFVAGLSIVSHAPLRNPILDVWLLLRIFKSETELFEHNLKIGQILSDNKTYLKFAAKNGFIKVLELQLEGKRKVSIQEFLRGYKI